MVYYGKSGREEQMKKTNREEYIKLIIVMLQNAKYDTVVMVYKKLLRESI